MEVEITDRMERFVEDQVKSGSYVDASDVVRHALRRLMETLAGTVESGGSTGPIATFRRPIIGLKVDLPLEMTSYLRAVVDQGLYLDESEVVRDALRSTMRSPSGGSSDPIGPIPSGPVPTE